MSEKHVTRDEFLYGQLKGNRSLYRGLAVVLAAATIACLIMIVAAVAIGRSDGALKLIVMALGVALPAYNSWGMYKDYSYALEEIGPDPTGVDTCRTYSARTAGVISASRSDSKTQRQLWIAYGILTITLLGMGAFLTVAMFSLQAGFFLSILGPLMMAGGFVFLVMTIKAFRNWRAAKYLESLE